MDKNIKEKLRELANSASTKINLNKVREDWRKVEQNTETIYFNEEQANNLINAIEKGKDTEIRDIDVISKIERGSESLKKLLDKNIKRDSEGRVLLSKDDEWREETDWNEFYNECELDIISTIFDNDDEENMNKEDIERLIEEEVIYREMRGHYVLNKEQRISAREYLLTDDDTYLYLYDEESTISENDSER